MFLGYIHTFRAIAIFFIIAMHSIDVFDWADSRFSERILRISISNGTVLFVFIAGYLFQHLSLRYQYKKYLLSKLRNVISPYFFVSIPAILIFTIFLKRETVWQGFYEDPVWLQVINFYFTGLHLAPFWFIPVITIFYLVSPAFVVADKYRVFYLFLPIFILLSCLVGRGGSSPIISFVHFFSIYSLGMFFSHYKLIINVWLPKVLVILISFSIVVILWLCEYYFTNTTYSYINLLQKIFLCFFILGVLIRLGEKATSHYVNLIADTSFGIFFVHSYVLTSGKLVVNKLLGFSPQGTILYYILITISTVFICMIVVHVIRKMLGSKSRMIIGS